jgi:hypothetical protein
LSARCAYFSVVAVVACPSIFPTRNRLSPAMTALSARVPGRTVTDMRVMTSLAEGSLSLSRGVPSLRLCARSENRPRAHIVLPRTRSSYWY